MYKKICVSVQLFLSDISRVCVCVYDNACQGDMRAKCSLRRGRARHRRLMRFRQATGGTPAQALNPWKRGAPEAHVDLSGSV